MALRVLGNPRNPCNPCNPGKRATSLLLLIALALVCRVAGMSDVVDRNRDYHSCPMSDQPEPRILHVATCDTRSGWREFMALKWWNVTGRCHMPICQYVIVIELDKRRLFIYIPICMDQIWTFNLVYIYVISYVSFCSTYGI
jgi:hypothetical protein